MKSKTSKLSRRSLLKASFSAAQLALMGRYGLLDRTAFANTIGDSNAPSRILTIYMAGGYHPLSLFNPLTPEQILAHVPEPSLVLGEQAFHTADVVENLAPAGGDGYDPIRVVRTWDPANPASREVGPSGYKYNPSGYAFKEYNLHEQLVAVHGVDQQTAAHTSGLIASMCGVAGPSYRAPAIQCVVANALASHFPDRPLPCVAIDGRRVPQALNLPTSAAPTIVPSIASLAAQLSDSPASNSWWTGLNDRSQRPAFNFGGGSIGDLPLTGMEAHTTAAARLQAGASNLATDAWLERLHNGLQGVGSLLARDVVTTLNNTLGVEHLPEQCTYGGQAVTGYERFGYRFGLANGGAYGHYNSHFDMALRLMKSDLSSAIHLHMPLHYFDSHSATGHTTNSLWFKGEMDAIGRLLGEMKQTPAPNYPGRTLLEDTLVLVFSEFSRTWPFQGDDHWPITSMFFAGGGVASNRSIGGFDTENLSGGPRGMPVDLIEENGQAATRKPKSADVAATVMRIMGLGFDDFFIPGGYGEIVGVRAT